MFNSQKNVIWQALILAIFVFAIGIFIGVLIENARTNQINTLYQQAELELLDIRTQADLYTFSNINCTNLIQENINFADRVYSEAKLLDKYENANKITDSIIFQHKKYDMLRALFWVNSIKLKQKCNANYNDIVYLYQYNNPSLDTRAKQAVFSKLLEQIKQDKGNNVMLIPLAGDNNISSVDILMKQYNISISELPVILLDEKTKIINLETKDQIETLLK